MRGGLIVKVAGVEFSPPPNGQPVLMFVVIVTLTGPEVATSDASIVAEADVLLGVVVA